VVDLDGDGRRDVISGSYWPGDIIIFRGQADGTFAKGEALLASSGKKVNAGPEWKSEKEPQMDSLAAAPHAADIDGDGDLDLLVGNIAGRVIAIPDTGSARSPKFDNEGRRAIEAAGAPLEVPGGDAGPFVADWDKDGAFDLIVGAGDGSVWLYRNEGSASKPRFAAGVALLPKSEYGYETPPQKGEVLRSHGLRTKPCAADVDGDGWLDLLVGDMLVVMRPEPELDAAQTARRDALRAERDQVDARIQARFEAIEKSGETIDTEKDAELAAAFGEIARIQEALAPLEAGGDYHGYVWYLRRLPPKGALTRS